MSKFLDDFRRAGTKIETPFLIRHVETHLIFGPISRHLACGYAGLVGVLLYFGEWCSAARLPLGQLISDSAPIIGIVAVTLLILTWTHRQQAIIGWIAVKGGLGIGALIMVTVGAGTSFQHGYSDAWVNLFLGIIWIPGVEFIPKVTPFQRFVTLGRIFLSIPCVYFGVRSGNWHW